MAKPDHILLENASGSLSIPILFENRSVLALDKPAQWLIVPPSWHHTTRNLQAALMDSIQARDFWAASRNLRYLRFIHRLDAETTGILLFSKSQGALPVYSRLFESRQINKIYLAVCLGHPPSPHWTCDSPLGPDPRQTGRVRICAQNGKPAHTRFQALHQTTFRGQSLTLVAAQPVTGRTHQIRVHLQATHCPILGDPLYLPAAQGRAPLPSRPPLTSPSLALRAAHMSFLDPFQKRRVNINAPCRDFLRQFHFGDIPSLVVPTDLPSLK